MLAWYIITLVVIAATIAYVVWNYIRIRKMPEGTPDMIEMAGIIRSGANTFMKTEYRTIAIVVAILAIVFSLFVERTSGITFLMGALMSSVVCVLGMRSATYANVRTANKARESMSIGETVKVALCGGSISGLSVQAFGLLGFILVLLIFGNVDPAAQGGGILTTLQGINPTIMHISTYSLGCSLVAMFNRVAGGNYTKAADISADILAKVRNDLPEDDSRVPNVIADFIGDNVNDIAGNCSDLLESFVATVAAALMISVVLFNKHAGALDQSVFGALTTYPVVMACLGLVGCLMGLVYAAVKKMGDNPSRELNLATWISAGLTLVLGFFGAMIVFSGVDSAVLTDTLGWVAGWISPWICAVLGIASGVAIGSITEYYTSTEYKPTRKLAEMAPEGEAFVITKGDAVGSRSVLLPVLVIGLALFVSGKIAGIYGVALAALGMLAFVGATVSIDAFGPIADNAGGLAESCHLPHEVRTITDKLDAVGNTTAAVGKGFAIGSAAFATVSLIVSYVGSYSSGDPDLNIASFVVVAGAIIGGALVEYFAAMLTDNTIDSAKRMADEGDKQLTPEVLAGKKTPDYNRMIKLAAQGALRKMLVPSVLAMVIPVIGGFVFGVQFVGGILIGATIVAIPRAIFMGNSGGAFDNAKKYIESGALKGHGKGTAAHKAAVTGDTVGDTRKDVVGVALDIFIKTMSTVANTLVSLFRNITLIR
ncbi:MAG: sodium-translocating pyrophosphatase [Clostridiales bacterium]|nr:sodium-translocating pyrophosphatase [Clostridiales bacterium]